MTVEAATASIGTSPESAVVIARAVYARRPRMQLEAWIALAVLLLVAVAVSLGPLVWTHDPEAIVLTDKYASPGLESPLGTDDFGRDLLSRILHGGRRTILGSLIVLAGCTVGGVVIGAGGAVLGGRWDVFTGRLIDLFLALPSLVVALGIVGVLGKSFPNLLVALILTGWPWYARIYRSLVLRERNLPYIEAAHSLGATRLRILVRHIAPNIAGPAVVVATVNLGNAMLSLAALSFLGLGVQPPQAEWGAMVSEARYHFQTHPWLIIVPGLAITLSTLCVNVLGDGLRDMLDVRSSRRHDA
jgi:ABC-type dipeptide/oligopeptide/nickel transport system permease subunit